jgi:hydrogenase expression/formation protein HypC
MCLGVPGKIVEIHLEHDIPIGQVDFGGIRRNICLAYVADEVEPGDYVIVHVGFAISRLDEDEAKRTMDILREMAELEELDHMREAPDPRGPLPAISRRPAS